jgi:hypothetical protein
MQDKKQPTCLIKLAERLAYQYDFINDGIAIAE